MNAIIEIPHCKHCLESFDADTNVLYIVQWVWVDTPSSPFDTNYAQACDTREVRVSCFQETVETRTRIETRGAFILVAKNSRRIGYTTALYSRSCHVIAFFVQLLLECISSQNYSSTECLYLNHSFVWISSSILLLVLQFPGNKEWVDMCVSLHVDMHMTWLLYGI